MEYFIIILPMAIIFSMIICYIRSAIDWSINNYNYTKINRDMTENFFLYVTEIKGALVFNAIMFVSGLILITTLSE